MAAQLICLNALSLYAAVTLYAHDAAAIRIDDGMQLLTMGAKNVSARFWS